jgi:hypothetical protein
MTFDHILSRLRGQKSRKTGAELHNLTRAMNGSHVTLGGLLVCFYIYVNVIFYDDVDLAI